MTHAASFPWRGVVRQAWQDLQPFPGRLGLTWRVALLCAIVAGVAMLYKVPEAAIGCYLIIFLARPNGAECVGQAIGLIILASVVVLAMAPVIQATAEYPLLRITVITATSFAFVFLGAASQLGEIGSIIGLVIAFVLTLVDQLPLGEVATRGLLYAWQMACMPMALMIVFNLVLGTSPHRLLQQTVLNRLSAAAAALEAPGPATTRQLGARLAEGAADADKQVMLARLFHTAPDAVITWLSGAATTSYRLLLAVAALPADIGTEARARLAEGCRAAADVIATGRRPLEEGGGLPQSAAREAPGEDAPALGSTTSPEAGAYGATQQAIAGLAAADGGSREPAPKPPFLAPDAFTNPDYQRYALKTTAAAITCYLIYSLINWQGIHTAMITCYVAALGTTGETVHKLALRICGCLVGAALGFVAILLVIPHLSSVGGLMALVFAGIFVAAWVSTGNERISYAGVQVGLAFLLTILNGFAPSLSMESGRDRVVGILLGNVVVYLFFTGIWPKSAAVEAREHLSRALYALSRLAGMAPALRAGTIADAIEVENELAKAEEQLRLLPFEPASERPSVAGVARLNDLLHETRATLPVLMFSSSTSVDVAGRLAEAAARIGREAGGPDRREATAGDGPGAADDGTAGGLDARAFRIRQLATG